MGAISNKSRALVTVARLAKTTIFALSAKRFQSTLTLSWKSKSQHLHQRLNECSSFHSGNYCRTWCKEGIRCGLVVTKLAVLSTLTNLTQRQSIVHNESIFALDSCLLIAWMCIMTWRVAGGSRWARRRFSLIARIWPCSAQMTTSTKAGSLRQIR